MARRARIGRKGYEIAPEDRAYIYRRDDYSCLGCGVCSDLTIDHITPISRGGADHRSNYQTLCRSCNARKGATFADYRPSADGQMWFTLDPPKPTLSERFLLKIRVSDDGCWLWTGARNSAGTGVMKVDGRPETASRVSWLIENGQLPDGQLYRTCGRDCVFAEHLALTPPLAELCPNGHPYAGSNVVHEGDRRRCRTCKNARARRYARKRALQAT